MAKGIIYVMTTVVPGLVKIGKTGLGNFEQRMYILESNGYKNVAGLKRHFAIEVEDYDEKEVLLDTIFSKSRVPGTELFAIDVNLVVQLLSSFDGTQVYPSEETRQETFETVTEIRETSKLPDGLYIMSFKSKSHDNAIRKASLKKENGSLILLAGSAMEPVGNSVLPKGWVRAKEDAGKDENDILLKDVVCSSLSMASSIVLGHSSNGWTSWQNGEGQLIDVYRKNDEEE